MLSVACALQVESWQTAEPAGLEGRPETRELNIGKGGASMYSPDKESEPPVLLSQAKSINEISMLL